MIDAGSGGVVVLVTVLLVLDESGVADALEAEEDGESHGNICNGQSRGGYDDSWGVNASWEGTREYPRLKST